MKRLNRLLKHAGLGFCAAFIGASAIAQADFPSKPVHVINPYAAGGVVDILTRAITERTSKTMGVPFVVDAKPGGAGSIGTDFVAQSPADGYTWLIATTSNAANMALMPNIRHDLLTAFVPVAQFAYSPNYFVVPASLPVSTVGEYVAMAKANPGKLSYGSAGIGSTPHLGFELFKHVAGIDVVSVPYKGAPPVIPDLVSGELLGHLHAGAARHRAGQGRARESACSRERRAHKGISSCGRHRRGRLSAKAVVAPWFAVMVPTATPAAVGGRRIQQEIKDAISAAEVVTRIESAGAVPLFRSSKEVGQRIQDEIVAWRALVKATGMKAE